MWLKNSFFYGTGLEDINDIRAILGMPTFTLYQILREEKNIKENEMDWGKEKGVQGVCVNAVR